MGGNMKHFTGRRGVAPIAALCLTLSAPSFAQEAEITDPTPEQAQAYLDAQTCVVILRKLDGADNAAKADAALARANALAAVNGDDTDEKAAKSLSDMGLIMDMASDEEMKLFTTACQAIK